MFGLKSMGKILGPEMLVEMLAGAGIRLAHQDLDAVQYATAFQSASVVAMRPGAKVIAMHGEDREGCRIEALIIVAPPPPPVMLN